MRELSLNVMDIVQNSVRAGRIAYHGAGRGIEKSTTP